MILLTLIGWILSKIEERKWDKRFAPVTTAKKTGLGYDISPAMWERCKGVNPTGKFNDIL